jgi:hypothetical protein
MESDLKEIFDGLKPKEKQAFFRDLDVEWSKSKINTSRDFVKNELQILKRVPITNRLTEFEFIELLDWMHFSAMIVWNTIARRLGEFGHSITAPESISDKEALPPEPT